MGVGYGSGSCLKALRTSSSFFVRPLHEPLRANTLRVTGAEDRALPGGNLSADSGAKTGLGPVSGRAPALKSLQLGLASTR
jgi:hypothetical protein